MIPPRDKVLAGGGGHTGRRRASSKAFVISHHQGMDPAADSLTASYQAAGGPPQMRTETRKPALTETLGPSDGPYCKGAINAFVDLKEGQLACAIDDMIQDAAGEVLRRGQDGSGRPLSAQQVKVLKAVQDSGRAQHHTLPFDQHDIHVTATVDGEEVAWGIDLQMRLPFLFMPASDQPKGERTLVKEQAGVERGGGIGLLWGSGMICFDAADTVAIPTAGTLSKTEQQSVTALVASHTGGRLINVGSLRSHDSLQACLVETLLPKLAGLPPLPRSTEPDALPYPATFTSRSQAAGMRPLMSAKCVFEQAAEQLAKPVNVLIGSSELEMNHLLLVPGSEGMPMHRPTLADLDTLTLVHVPWAKLGHLSDVSAAICSSGSSSPLAGLYSSPGSISIVEAESRLEAALRDKVAQLLAQAQSASAARSGSGAAPADAPSPAATPVPVTLSPVAAAASPATPGTAIEAAGTSAAQAAGLLGAAAAAAAEGTAPSGSAASPAGAGTSAGAAAGGSDSTPSSAKPRRRQPRPAAATAVAQTPSPTMPATLLAHQQRSMASRAGGPGYDAATWEGRTRGDYMRPPAAPLPLPLPVNDQLRQSAGVLVLRQGGSLEIPHDVAGKRRPFHKTSHLLTYGYQLITVVPDPGTFAAAQQVPDKLYLYSPAALPSMQGVLSAGAPLQLLEEAAVSPEQLPARLATYLCSCTDVQAASTLPQLLRQLATRDFAVGLFAVGVDMTAGGMVPTLGQGGWTAEGWLELLQERASDKPAAQRLIAAARALDATGFVSIDSMRSLFHGERRAWRLHGVNTEAVGALSLEDHNDRLAGGGDAERGRQIRAAMDRWQEQLSALGVGPVPGLPAVSGKPSEEKLQAWRAELESGWGAQEAVSAAFDAALAAGASLGQLASRFCTSKQWEGDLQRATEAMRQRAATTKKRKSPHELLLAEAADFVLGTKRQR